MAAQRNPLSESEFISQMIVTGVRQETAKFVWDEAAAYYIEPLRPDPSDHWEATMRIDPGDLEDVTARFWQQQGWEEPSRKDPVILPNDPTLQGYALWLDQQRQVQK